MNSPFANLFLSIQTLIANLADGNGKNYFKYVDQDFGQLEMHNGDNRAPVSWPCVLIDIDKSSFTAMGSNVQNGHGAVCLRLGFPPFSASSAATPQTYIEKAIYFYDLETILHDALQGTQPSYIVDSVDVLAASFKRFQRISAETEKRSDFIRVRKVCYSLAQQDYSTKKVITLTPAALDLTDEILT